MRYYSTQRPIGPGTFPRKDGTESIWNFDDRIFCEEIGREAWGYIEYRKPLEPDEIAEYELTPGGSESIILVGQDGRISPQYVMDKIKERLDMRKEYCYEA